MDTFFAKQAPELISLNGRVTANGIRALQAPPLGVEVDGEGWTVLGTGESVRVQRGFVEGAFVVSLSRDQFSDWAQNQMSLNGFVVSRALQFRNGSPEDVSVWDSLWMAFLEGWPVTGDDVIFRDLRGASLDLAASFTSEDHPDDIAHFLREAGFLRLKGWLDPKDIAAISADMDNARPLYTEGDGKSWWATLSDNSRTCVRLQEFVDHSPTTVRLLSSDTWHSLRLILGGQHDVLARKPAEGRVIEALFKPVGVVAGPSDLSFHRDCHLGRHAYVCSRVTLGIPLTPSNEANGVLQVVAGSHRAMMPAEMAKSRSYLPIVSLPVEPGDITVHLSCTLHASTRPVFAERRVMYTEIPLASLETGGVPADTSVNNVRERINDILRQEHEHRSTPQI